MRWQFIAFALATLVHGGPHAQTAPTGGQDFEALQKQMEAAQASAAKPGDEGLSCEQLEEQFAATASDPTLLATVQQAGSQAQKDMATAESAQGEVAKQAATTVVGSVVPGASMGAMMATAASAEAAKARGTARLQSMMGNAGQLAALMPTLMRGEWLMRLATAKKCDWASGLVDPAAEPGKPAE